MLFVDDGGVLNDTERRAPEWRRLIGEFFTPRLGGTPEAWAAANAAVYPGILERYRAHARVATSGVRPFLRAEDRRWLLAMCEQVGVSAEPEEVDELVAASHRYITRKAACAYPDAPQAIRDVARSGITLHTASGETAPQLDGYLRGMGVRELFDRLYGVDLVDRFKSGPQYYAAILEDSGVDPAEAAVIDDSVEALDWAASCGLRTIHIARHAASHIARDGRGDPRHERIPSLDALALLL